MKDQIGIIKKDIYAKAKCKALTRTESYDIIQEKLNELNDKERKILFDELRRDYSTYERLSDVFQWITIYMTGLGMLVSIGIKSYSVSEFGASPYLSLLKTITVYIVVTILILSASSRYRSKKLNETQYLLDIVKKVIEENCECTATVYNLKRGKNDELNKKCKPLADYVELIKRIRDNQKNGLEVRGAVDKAVDSCIEDGILGDFLSKHKAELLSVCITEFDEKVYIEGIREEGRNESRKNDTIKMLNNNKTPNQIAEFCNYDLEYVKAIQKEIMQSV